MGVFGALALHVVAHTSDGNQLRGSKDSCDNGYQCPAHSYRKPNRICYNNFDDCECDSGYKKDGSRCVPQEPCVQIQCSIGTELVGDINGCGGKCEPCAVPSCSPGTQVVGMDGNGCGGTCEPCAQIQCSFGTFLVGDINGCGGKCEPCAMISCSPGSTLVGTDGNGCGGRCV